jgi:predicted regulator of Ras-like GTPase activity (Roadblock/LC7/MglB family)
VEEPQRLKRRVQQSWKNNVEQDLGRLLDRKGVLGAFLISKTGEIVTQVFQETATPTAVAAQNKSSLMQIVRKLTPLMQGVRNVPLRRTIFETREGSVIFYSMENGIVGCILDTEFDVVSIMLEIHTVADMINSHLNNTDVNREVQDSRLRENREELRAFSQDLLREIERHFGPVTTEQIIQRMVR